MSEAWAARTLWCPDCTTPLVRVAANRPSLDLQCAACGLEFELKSKKIGARRLPVRSITGGEYSATCRRFGEEGGGPNLILAEYEPATFAVARVTLFPSFFLVPSIVRPRRPLGPGARRAGWQGCTIKLDMVQPSGRLVWLDHEAMISGEDLRADWLRVISLASATASSSRGWLVDVLRVVESLPAEFTLDEVYAAGSELAALHPGNNNVSAKIRQQLQLLRDAGRIAFEERGRYRKVS
jgi:type II restriction enzyme